MWGIRGFDRQFAAFRHRIPRIDRKVQQSGLEFIRVHFYAPKPGTEHRLDRDRLAKSPVHELGCTLDKSVNIDRLRIERLSPRECEKPLRQRGRTARAVHRLTSRALQPAGIFRQMSLQGLKVSKNDLQQVIEVMGDTAGQLADSLHFLRLAQSLFFLLELSGPFNDLPLERSIEVS
jgi:hypothetical protein